MPCFHPIGYLLAAKQFILFIRAIQVMQMTSALLFLAIVGGNFYLLQTAAMFFTLSRHHWSVRMELLRCCWLLL